jgi:hypothetical protein
MNPVIGGPPRGLAHVGEAARAILHRLDAAHLDPCGVGDAGGDVDRVLALLHVDDDLSRHDRVVAELHAFHGQHQVARHRRVQVKLLRRDQGGARHRAPHLRLPREKAQVAADLGVHVDLGGEEARGPGHRGIEVDLVGEGVKRARSRHRS